MGRNIEDSNGDSIGAIEEMIIDPQSGQVQQVIVGVGGFLGIGEKNVALRWDQLRIEYEMNRPDRTQPPALTGAAPGPAAPAAGAPEVRGTEGSSASTPGAAPMGTTSGPSTTPARRAGVSTADLRIVVNITKEQLRASPEYRYPDEEARTGTGTKAPATAPAAPGGTPR